MSPSKEYAVVFKTKRQLPMPAEYSEYAVKLAELAKTQKGFLRIESVADASGNGISVSYWDSLEAIRAWKENALHKIAQSKGQEKWYLDYNVEICEIVRRYGKGGQ